MDFFRILIKRIFYKIPIKLLLIFIIVLLLGFVCFNAKSFASVEIPVYYENSWVDFPIDITLKNYYVIIKSVGVSSDTHYYLFTYNTDSDFYLQLNSGNNYVPSYFWTASYGSRIYADVYEMDFNNFTLTKKKTNDITFNITGTTPLTLYYVGGSKLINIMTKSSNVNNSTGFLESPPEPFTAPYIVDTTDIPTWSFDYLAINMADVNPYYQQGNVEISRKINLEMDYNGITYTINCWDYLRYISGNNAYINIPVNELSKRFVLRNGNNIAFTLFVQPDDNPNNLDDGNWSLYPLGSFTLSLTTEQQQIVNEDSEKDTLGSIDIGINNLNNDINNLNNNLTSSNYNQNEINDKMSSLGQGINIADNTHIEQLFIMLYNAFCNNEVVEFSVNIPFINKTLTINSSNISSHYPIVVLNIAHLFVWGMVLLFIVKDIRGMINKVSEGNIENVSNDVKKEVL